MDLWDHTAWRGKAEGVWGTDPQRGPGAEPRWGPGGKAPVAKSWGKAPEAENKDINFVLRITLVNA